jgi:DNA primase
LISKNTIDTVFETARVEEVIGDFVQLKRAGSNFKGLSPFSDERSPSFMVSPAKQIWKDFSSGKGGNAVAFSWNTNISLIPKPSVTSPENTTSRSRNRAHR